MFVNIIKYIWSQNRKSLYSQRPLKMQGCGFIRQAFSVLRISLCFVRGKDNGHQRLFVPLKSGQFRKILLTNKTKNHEEIILCIDYVNWVFVL